LTVTSTVEAQTTFGHYVTISSNATVNIFVKNNTLYFEAAKITSSLDAFDGINNWRTIDIAGNGGTLTLDGGGTGSFPAGIIAVTGNPSPTIPNGPAGPVLSPGANGTTSTTIINSLLLKLPPLGFALIPVNTSLTLADNAKVTVEGGNELPSGMLPSGQTFVYAPLLISGASITFGANSLITSDR